MIGGGRPLLCENWAAKLTPKTPISNQEYSLAAPQLLYLAKKVQLTRIESTLRAFQ